MVSLTKYPTLESMELPLTSFKQSWLTWVAHFKHSPIYSRKYFTWRDGYNFLPHIFNLRSVSKTLPLALKIITSVLVIWREILLASSQCRRIFKSLFKNLFISFIDCFTLSKQVSLAKWKVVEFLKVKVSSLINIRKSNGLRTKPWGTPCFIKLWLELKPIMEIECNSWYWVWLHK